jgi:hypothetical protein
MRKEMNNLLGSAAILSICVIGAAHQGVAQQFSQPSFPSAAAAMQSLVQAVDSNDEQAIQKILGGSSELTSSGAEDQDKADHQLFCQKYKEMHRLHREGDGSVTLFIGAENWPFPVPLVQKDGVWRFEPASGKKEIMVRQIGENELTAIAICREFGAGIKEDRAARNLDESEENFPASLAAKMTDESTGHPVLIYGYYFRLVPTRGGKALVAYPAEYRSSGVMTFVSIGNNLVYEKDSGPRSSELASAMAAFRKDTTWRAAP